MNATHMLTDVLTTREDQEAAVFEAIAFLVAYRNEQNTCPTCARWQAFKRLNEAAYNTAMQRVTDAYNAAAERDQGPAFIATMESMGW